MYQTIPEHIIVPKGTKKCTIKTSKYEKDKVTAILLIRADGQKYEPKAVFKATQDGRIHKTECV